MRRQRDARKTKDRQGMSTYIFLNFQYNSVTVAVSVEGGESADDGNS